MAIEAVAALAAKEVAVEAAKEAALQSAREIAQKMATEATGGGNELQTAMMERQGMQEGFRVGEMPETKEDGREILKQREADAAEELQEKLRAEGMEPQPSDAPSDGRTQEKGIHNPDQIENQKNLGTQDSAQDREGTDSGKDVSDETGQKLKSDYLDDLKNRSEVPDTIDKDKAMEETYERQTVEETQARRNEFNNSKSELIKKWEEEHGRPWPRYEKDVYHNGNRIRKAEDLYDCHHIKPLSHGGKNEVSNITPMHALEHYDRQGVHASDSPYAKLDNYLKEKEIA